MNELDLRRRYRSFHANKRLREAWERSLTYAVESAETHQVLMRQAQKARIRVGITISHPNAVGALKPVLDAAISTIERAVNGH